MNGKRSRSRPGARLLGLAVVAVLPLGALQALPPELTGENVASIPDADGINGWSALDNQRLLLNLDGQQVYLLTLKHQCHGLGWAQDVSVSMSNNTIWAGFDAIRADGRACPIGSIQRLSPRALLENGR